MSIINNNLLLAGTDEAYNLTRSLRFRSSASAYLNRTPSTSGTGGGKTWTFSAWIKRGSLGSASGIFDAYNTSGPSTDSLAFRSDDTLTIYFANAGGGNLTTTQVFRDPSAWYHVVVVLDTTQATASNRVKIYLNGTQITAFSTANYPSQNAVFNWGNTQANNIGRKASAVEYFDGYLTEVNFIDGQALTPSSFGETDIITGVWKPKRYAGTYGTNGFYLPFTDNSALTTSSNAGLGKDFSGNGNYWTTNNISITSGVTYDSMTDVPTLTSATAANFCVWNAADPNLLAGGSRTISNGNLTVADASTTYGLAARGTFWQSSGKWYWEINCTSIGDIYGNLGFCDASNNGVFYQSSGQRNPAAVNTGTTSYGSSYTTGDIIGVALDLNANSVTFYKNNVSQGAVSFSAGMYTPAVGDGSNGSTYTWNANFGQRPFAYTPPTGYVALNAYNLPDSTIVKGNTVMDATTFTANGTTQTITNNAGFKPDLIWQKNRGTSQDHYLVDSNRGISKILNSNTTTAEGTDSNFITSINSNGYSLGSSNFSNGQTIVAWQWQAGQGTTSSNTSGSVTSTVSANASAGFSIATFTMPTSGVSTIGHGLGVAPQVIFMKARTGSVGWAVYHASVGNGAYLQLNNTAASTVDANAWNNTSPTSSVFTIGTAFNNLGTYLAYCFAPIAGYSAFGSYSGNGSTDGTFVYLGFRARYIMIKRTDSTSDWTIFDTARNSYNTNGARLWANLSSAEGSGDSAYSIFSNGFKLGDADGSRNASGGTYIYMAFAETPTKFALAR